MVKRISALGSETPAFVGALAASLIEPHHASARQSRVGTKLTAGGKQDPQVRPLRRVVTMLT